MSASGFNPADIKSQTLPLPAAYVNTAGNAVFLGPLTNSPRTYQLLINESELTTITGRSIKGLTFRLPLSATSNWPATDAVYANYDIYLSESVTPAARSFTFANNVVGVQKKVRSGSLTIAANSFTFGGSPVNNFGSEITFDSTYLYSGGHLLIEIRHDGFSGTSRTIDAAGTSVSGYGTLFSAAWTGTYNGTLGQQGNFSMTSLSLTGTVGINDPVAGAETFVLGQNYPNPFNPSTIIKYTIAQGKNSNVSFIRLAVYDAMGRQIAILVNEQQAPGNYETKFDGSEFSNGVYFYKMEIDGIVAGKKSMILIK
ncbi:MAG: T9SS type A sorting domain-containing protein [bacterium]